MSTKNELENVITDMENVMEEIKDDLDNAMKNKAAAGRVRKQTIHFAKIGKEFRQLSIAHAKGE